MYKVKDESGNYIPSLLKSSLGTILVKPDSEYTRYVHSRQQNETINKLNADIIRQEQAINNIMSEMSEIKHILLSMIEKNSTKG